MITNNADDSVYFLLVLNWVNVKNKSDALQEHIFIKTLFQKFGGVKFPPDLQNFENPP